MHMNERPVSVLVEQLPADAKWWVKSLSVNARIEIDRLLREIGVEAFAICWRSHRATLEELEKSFDTRL